MSILPFTVGAETASILPFTVGMETASTLSYCGDGTVSTRFLFRFFKTGKIKMNRKRGFFRLDPDWKEAFLF